MKQTKAIYNLTTILTKPIVNKYIKRNVTGTENIPEKGPCILAFNHPRRYDPLIIAISSNRMFHFVADESIYKNFHRKIYYNLVGCIKSGNESSFNCIKKIRRLLKKGESIFVFSRGSPEKPLKKSKPTLANIVLRILEKEGLAIPIISGNIKYVEENGNLQTYINFHKPINPENYFEEYKTNKIKAINKLTEKIDEMIDSY